MSSTLRKTQGIVAIFPYLDDFCQVVEDLNKDRSFGEHELFCPTSYHELMDLAENRYGRSEVRWFTLIGGLLGLSIGFGLPLFCDYDWPIVVGGKTAGLHSIIAYFIIGFEMMILLGAIGTIFGMLIMGRLPNPKAGIYDERLTDDRFAVFVPDVDTESQQARFLRDHGAEEVYQTC